MSGPLPYITMVELVHYWSCHDAHKPAFIFRDKHGNRFELTRGQVYQLGGRWAAVLKGGGVGRKEKVVSTLPNGPERVLCDVGIVMAGATVVNAQCLLADGSDLLHVLRQSKASAICVNPDLDTGPWQVLKQHVHHDPDTNTVTSPTLPNLRKVFFIRRTAAWLCQDVAASSGQADTGHREPGAENSDNRDLLGDGFGSPETADFIARLQVLDEFYQAEVAADETVVVFTTSGSTGFSKLVPHTHASLFKCLRFLKRGDLDQFSVTFNCAPIGWLGGYVFIYMSVGQGRVLLDMWYGAPDDMAAVAWDMIAQEGCGEGTCMPYLLPKILALENRKAWKMKILSLGGQPMKKEIIDQALQLSEKVLTSYVSTELLMTSVIVVGDVSEYQDFLVGKLLPDCTLKACDREGKEVARGTKGELYVKTPWMTQGYLDAEDTPASFTADGFLKTGDIGQMLEDGSLLVEGRQHDAIHRGSYIFYPAWLESRIMRCCPGLRDVFVVGVPDPEMGEELCACFVASDPSVTEHHVRRLVEEDITAKLDDPLSPRPRYYLRFQTFPATYTDKPVRKDVRRLAAERLNLA
ncbi:2-succinylbenzoate--CoA ligase-like [Babylonia areolata]|uniref:2-succinylbenzoate--CoA ligase-like n=1 Tax=Babylonia areolata TaxID=304850 RepID=UPI003FD516DD